MAAEGVVKKIVELATGDKKKFSKARDAFDQELAVIRKIEDKEEQGKQRTDFIKAVRDGLKEAKGSLIYVLKGDPIMSREVTYDAFGETMEPMYYWLLDFLKESMGYAVDKTADFFSASEAGGYFGEMGMRRTNLEKRAVELTGTINAVVKSIINLLWDLKTFDLRLKHYDDVRKGDKDTRRVALEALKGIWLNEVDKGKGNAAIDVLAQNLNFITLRDAFMVIPVQDWHVIDAKRERIDEIKKKAEQFVTKMDLTEVVKRILAPRAREFVEWVYASETELRKRKAVELAYLKAQVAAMKVYAQWTRPYLIATQKLIPAEYKQLLEEHKELGLGPAAVPTPFHAMWFYLELQAKKKAEIKELKRPPFEMTEIKLKNEDLRPHTIIEVRTAFRGAPQMGTMGARGERGTAFTGKTLVKFVTFVMSKEHITLLEREREEEILQFIDAMTTETLQALAEDLNKYLKEEEKASEAPKPKPMFELPFKELWSSVKKFNDEAKKILQKLPNMQISDKEAWAIARLKLIAESKSKKDLDTLYDTFKKSHKMLAK